MLVLPCRRSLPGEGYRELTIVRSDGYTWWQMYWMGRKADAGSCWGVGALDICVEKSVKSRRALVLLNMADRLVEKCGLVGGAGLQIAR